MFSEGIWMERGYYWVTLKGETSPEIAYRLRNGGWLLTGDEKLYGTNNFQVIGPRLKGQEDESQTS